VEVSVLVLNVNQGGFVEINTGREIIRVHVNKFDDFVVSLGFDAPQSVRILRDTLVTKAAGLNAGATNPLEETHVRS
jgi:sRNA-binding carbon storage regulator CsrA